MQLHFFQNISKDEDDWCSGRLDWLGGHGGWHVSSALSSPIFTDGRTS